MIYFRNKVIKYILLFEGRTGSSYLISSINSHPRVTARPEILVKLKNAAFDKQESAIRNALTPPLLGPSRAIGFKTKLRDITDPRRFAGLLRELDVKIVHMQRRNRVKSVISQIRSRLLKEITNEYNVYKNGQQLPPVTIPVEQFNEALVLRKQRDEKLRELVEQIGLDTLDIFYEDLLLDESDLLARVYRFLDVTALRTTGKLYKNTSDDLRDSVINFDELRSQYVNTEYHAMFDEVLAN